MTSAEIVLLKEIVGAQSESWLGKTLRVIGKLKSLNVYENTAIIEHGAAMLQIDTSLLGTDFDYKLNSSYDWIGTLERDISQMEHKKFVLRPRIIRNISALDVNLYEKVLLLRRKYLASVSRNDAST